MLKLYLKLGIPTLLVCIVASAGLAATYAVTKGAIAEQDRLAQERALKAVVFDAKSFEKVGDEGVIDTATDAAGDVPVDSIFEALDGNGETVGWGIMVKPRGYGGPMKVVVGVDRNGKVTGVTIVSHNETPGLGTKAVGTAGGQPPAYLSTFKDAESADAVAKLDTIMGATKSSRGARNGVVAALRIFDAALREGGSQQ